MDEKEIRDKLFSSDFGVPKIDREIPRYPQLPPEQLIVPGNEHLGWAVMCLAILGFIAISMPLFFVLFSK